MTKRLLVVLGGLALVLGVVSPSVAGPDIPERTADGRRVNDGKVDTAAETGPGLFDEQHGSPVGHIPGSSRNVVRVGRLRLTTTEGGISDVAYFGGFAYLGAWARECPNGGVHIVDVRDPAHPTAVGFLPAPKDAAFGTDQYVSEGVHVFHMSTDRFTGDVLAVDHESCDTGLIGGFSLYDVTDPTDPWPLVLAQGDGTEGGPDGDPTGFTHGYHSVFGWQAGQRAFLVGVDNWEFPDVDIWNITDPARPRLIAETSLLDWPDLEVAANGDAPFLHDMVVRKVDFDGDGKEEWVMGASYWDAGWVFLDVTHPAAPVFLDDTHYRATDPLTGFSPPEGNAHQGEWSSSERFFIGTDEDFSTSRFDHFSLTTGPNAGDYDAGEFGWTVPILQLFEGGAFTGPTVFGGSGCEEDVNGNGTPDREEVPDASVLDGVLEEGDARVVVFERGVCFFSIKVESGQLAGYDVVIIGNHHAGAGGGAAPDAHLCGGQGHVFDITAAGVCIGHRALHLLFNDDVEFATPSGTTEDLPPIGTLGERVEALSMFDGWGYIHLFNARSLREIDVFAAPATLDPEVAFGFGIHSVHEIATDQRPGVDMGYLAWYGSGLRVIKFGPDGIKGVGHYVDVAGSNFWGVEVWDRGPNKRPLILMSDRDSGLWIFKYTGPE